MPPARSSKPPVDSKRWLMLAGLGVGVLAAGAFGFWLLMGGTGVIMRSLPDGVVKLLGEKPGEKYYPPEQNPPAPWDKPPPGKGFQERPSYAEEPEAEAIEEAKAAEPGAEGNAEPPTTAQDDAAKAQAVMAAVKQLADAADEAIARYSDRGASDQEAYLAAEKAIAALRSAPIRGGSEAVRVAAREQRDEWVLQKQKALDEAKRLGRATHTVAVGPGKTASLREAASAGSTEVAELEDGTLVKVFLDTGTGWARAEALSGNSAGKNGYVRSGQIRAVRKGGKR